MANTKKLDYGKTIVVISSWKFTVSAVARAADFGVKIKIAAPKKYGELNSINTEYQHAANVDKTLRGARFIVHSLLLTVSVIDIDS